MEGDNLKVLNSYIKKPETAKGKPALDGITGADSIFAEADKKLAEYDDSFAQQTGFLGVVTDGIRDFFHFKGGRANTEKEQAELKAAKEQLLKAKNDGKNTALAEENLKRELQESEKQLKRRKDGNATWIEGIATTVSVAAGLGTAAITTLLTGGNVIAGFAAGATITVATKAGLKGRDEATSKDGESYTWGQAGRDMATGLVDYSFAYSGNALGALAKGAVKKAAGRAAGWFAGRATESVFDGAAGAGVEAITETVEGKGLNTSRILWSGIGAGVAGFALGSVTDVGAQGFKKVFGKTANTVVDSAEVEANDAAEKQVNSFVESGDGDADSGDDMFAMLMKDAKQYTDSNKNNLIPTDDELKEMLGGIDDIDNFTKANPFIKDEKGNIFAALKDELEEIPEDEAYHIFTDALDDEIKLSREAINNRVLSEINPIKHGNLPQTKQNLLKLLQEHNPEVYEILKDDIAKCDNPSDLFELMEKDFYNIVRPLDVEKVTNLENAASSYGVPLKDLEEDFQNIQTKTGTLIHKLMDELVPKSSKPEVIKIEKELDRLGVKVNCSDDLEMAQKIKETAELLRKAKYILPDSITVTPFLPASGMTLHTFNKNHSFTSQVYIKSDKHKALRDNADLELKKLIEESETFKNAEPEYKEQFIKDTFVEPKSDNYSSTKSPLHVLLHECEHASSPATLEQTLYKMSDSEAQLAEGTSGYAANLSNGLDFRAEMLPLLVLGGKASKEQIALYKKLGGTMSKPVIPALDFFSDFMSAYARAIVCAKMGLPPSEVNDFIYANKVLSQSKELISNKFLYEAIESFSKSSSVGAVYLKHLLYKLPLPDKIFEQLMLNV